MIDVDLPLLDKINGMLRTATLPYGYCVAHGYCPDHYVRRIIGYNGAVGTTIEDITTTSANISIPTEATAMEVISVGANNGDDAAGGTGVTSVRIHGLDAQWREITEDISMNGGTAVPTVNTYIRINNFYAASVGAGGVVAGATGINLRHVDDTPVYSQIAVGGTTMFQALWTVPANREAYIIGWNAGATGKETRIILRATRDWDTGKLTSIFYTQDIISTESATTYKPFIIPIKCPPMCDIKVSAASVLAGATVGCAVELWYENL